MGGLGVKVLHFPLTLLVVLTTLTLPCERDTDFCNSNTVNMALHLVSLDHLTAVCYVIITAVSRRMFGS